MRSPDRQGQRAARRRWRAGLCTAFVFIILLASPAGASTIIAISVAGTGTAAYWGDGGGASTTTVDAPKDVAVDAAGDVFIADTTNNRVRMVPASSGTYFGQVMTAGDMYTVAGTGTACSTHTPAGCGYTSGGLAQAATAALLDAPSGVGVDASGNLYIADKTNNMVALVARSACSSACPFGLSSTVVGDIYAVAGTGTACSTHTPAGCSYNAAATSAKLDAPSGVALDSSGNLYIADTTDNMVAMVARSACSSSCPFGLSSTVLGYVYAVAGTGTACSTHTPAGCLYNAAATSAKLDAPGGVAVDSSGNLYIADTTNQMVAMVARSACSSSCPFGLSSTVLGYVYAVAGTGTACSTHSPAGCLYNAAATSATLDAPGGVAVDSAGNLYIADTTNQMVAMVARSACSSSCPFGLSSTSVGYIYAIAGTGTACSTHTPAGCGYTSSGLPQAATAATLDAPGGVAVDSSGNLYIADTTDQMVAEVAGSACSSSCHFGLSSTLVGDIYAIAGTGTAAYTGDGGGAATTTLNAPSAVAVDVAGDVFIADTSNDRVRMVPASTGTFFGQAMTRNSIYTVAGTGTACSTHTPAGCGYTSGGVPQLATTALLDLPGGVATDASGNLYIADTSDNMVALVAATSCSSSCPFGLSSTTAGDIYTVAGTGTACATHTPAGCLYNAAATSADLDAPSGVALDSSGNLYLADKTDNMVALVAANSCASSCAMELSSTTQGDIYSVAGTGTAAYWGDGGGASTTTVDAPKDVAVDAAGDVFIADTTNNRVRMVPASSGTYFGQVMTAGDMYTVAGTGTACSTHTPAGCGYTSGGLAQAATAALLDAPSGVGVDASGNLYIADKTNNMVALVARSACSSACPFGLSSTVVGDIYAVAGTGTACSTHTPAGCSYNAAATSAKLDAPSGVALDSSGNLYIADTTDNMVAMVARSACSSSCPFGLSSTVLGYVYAVAGTGTACSTHTPAGCLYNAAATSAKLDAPGGVAVDSSGNLYIADTTNQMVAMVARSACSSSCPFGLSSTVLGYVYAVAGTGTACSTHSPAGCLYNAAATSATLDAPGGVAVDSAGNLYIADTTNQMVAMVARSACSSSCPFGLSSTSVGYIYAIAGTGTACSTHTPAGCGYTSSGLPQAATAATLDAPGGVAVDSSGNLYIADTTDQMVAEVAGSACSSSCHFGLSSTLVGDIYAIAGTGTAAYTGDGGGAATTTLNAPSAVAVDVAGDVFIADTSNDRVRMVPASTGTFFGQAMTRNSIYTVAGTGTACSTHTPAGCGYTSGGVPQLATTALLDLPGGVATDASGNLYIADTSDNMVALVAATSCSSSCPFGLSSTTAGDIYTVAGTGTACASATGGCGDTGSLASSTLNAPSGVSVTPSASRLYIADKTDRRIREIISTPTVLQLTSAVSVGGTLNGQNLLLPNVLTADVVPSTYSVSGAQWSLAITSTTFTTGTASLPTTGTAISAPIVSCDAWFTVCTQVVPVAGDPPGYPFSVPAGSTPPTSATFFSDETGTGAQTLSFPFQVSVPANSRSGIYSSTWTITVQSGP